MDIPCKISDYSCPYHSCMGDYCQLRHCLDMLNRYEPKCKENNNNEKKFEENVKIYNFQRNIFLGVN
jgi:hypothetical protein